MKKHIGVGISLLLTVCTAVAGTLMYGQDPIAVNHSYVPATSIAQDQPSAATIEMWKATASSSEYLAPKAPI
jgi:UPF0716 family protein affecting phage T7 exclusion